MIGLSPPLTGLPIDRKVPGLKLRPGEKQAPRWGTWREYIDRGVEA
ncbi:hypothetical protein [Nocardia sp. NPDC006630]